MDEEKQSSLTTETTNSDDGKTIVDWKGDADPSHPHNWSKSRKWFIIGLTSLTCFNGYVTAVAISKYNRVLTHAARLYPRYLPLGSRTFSKSFTFPAAP